MKANYNLLKNRQMKTKEELNTLKEEYETLTSKLKELNVEELNNVAGGSIEFFDDKVPKYDKPITQFVIPNSEVVMPPDTESSCPKRNDARILVCDYDETYRQNYEPVFMCSTCPKKSEKGK